MYALPLASSVQSRTQSAGICSPSLSLRISPTLIESSLLSEKWLFLKSLKLINFYESVEFQALSSFHREISPIASLSIPKNTVRPSGTNFADGVLKLVDGKHWIIPNAKKNKLTTLVSAWKSIIGKKLKMLYLVDFKVFVGLSNYLLGGLVKANGTTWCGYSNSRYTSAFENTDWIIWFLN